MPADPVRGDGPGTDRPLSCAAMRSSLRWFLLLCAAGVGCDATERGAAPSAGRPSVIVITLDTVRADALGAYGQKLPVSSHIDALAAEGLLFEQVVSSAPSTFPSHASLFTGQQPYAHGVRSNVGYQFAEDNETLAERLSAAGYRTAAEVAAPVLARGRGLAQGFDEYRDPDSLESVVEKLAHQRKVPRHNDRSAADITDRGIDFVRRNADTPFFLWLHYFDAHRPWKPEEPQRSRFAKSPYHAEIAGIDAQIGRLRSEIEALGLRDRILVVVTADHGEGLGQHGEDTHSFFVYDSTIRIPLIFWGAEVVPRGRRSAALVRSVDVAPTLLDLLGLPALSRAQGVSLLPLFADPARDPGLVGYGESVEPLTSFGSSVLRFVRKDRWKYIHKIDPALYDVTNDPEERHDLAARHPERVRELEQELRRLVESAPPKPADAEAKMDPATLAQLEALGYLGSAAAGGLEDEVAALELRGPDPDTRARDVVAVSKGHGALYSEDLERAERLFRRVVENNPGTTFALDGLIKVSLAQENDEQSIALLRQSIELGSPSSDQHRVTLGGLFAKRGEWKEAEAQWVEALAADSCLSVARLLLSESLRERKAYAEQRALLEAAPGDCAGSEQVRNALAYLLATSPRDELRDAARALVLARQVVEESGGTHPDYLDTLGCALAETGDLAAAEAELQKALALVEGQPALAETRAIVLRHLESVRRRESIREP